MSTVPVIQDSAQLQTDTGRQRVRADPDAFGAAQARGTAALAQSVGRVGEVVDEIDTEFDRANARELDNQLSARIRDRFHNPEDGFFSTERGRGRNAADNRAAIEAEIDAAAVEIGGQARSPRAAAAFRNVAQQRVASALGDLAEHSTRQRVAYENEVDGTALNEALDNIIAAYDNPAALTANLATADSIIARTAQRNGLGPELQTRAMDEFRSDVYSRVIVQLAATDPQAAEEMYALRAPDMTAQDRAELRTTMNGVRRQADEDIVDQAWVYVSENRAIPPELWAQVPGSARIDIQNERRQRAEGGAGTGNRTLIEDLTVEAVANPAAFARRDLRAVRSQLGSHYDNLAVAQAEIRRGSESADVAQTRTQFNALRDVASTTLNMRLSAEDPENLTPAARAFNAALLQAVEGHMAANPGQGIDTETGQILIGRAWVGMRGRDVTDVTRDQGLVEGDRGRSRRARVRATTEVNVPYDAIKPALARRIGSTLRRRLGGVPSKGEVENAYAALLSADPQTPQEVDQVLDAIVVGGN